MTSKTNVFDPLEADLTYNELAVTVSTEGAAPSPSDVSQNGCDVTSSLFKLIQEVSNFHFKRSGSAKKFAMVSDQATQYANAEYFHERLASCWGEPFIEATFPIPSLHRFTRWVMDDVQIDHSVTDEIDPITECKIVVQEFRISQAQHF